jgi:alpha-N-arabinofuranosidase
MVNWEPFMKLVNFGLLAFRVFAQPFGLFKANKEIKGLNEAAGPPPNPANLTIDAGRIEAEIDPLIYGGFIEVLGKCIYGGIWDEYNKNLPLLHGGMRQDVLNEIRALKLSVIRWPGGCFSDVYHWKEGIGPREQRKIQPNKHWHDWGPKIGPKHDNHFGSDEFMLFAREVGVEPLININFGTGTPEEAAQWVEYMNSEATTEYGAIRAQFGHPEPYKVKFWGIANEIFGNWEKGYLPAQKYAQRYLEFARAMRTVDPTIKLIAVGADSAFPNWNRQLLEIAAEQIDYLSLHVYIPGTIVATLKNRVRDFYNIIAGAFEVERRIQWVANTIKEVLGPEKEIPIILDEWAPWWNARQLYEGYYTLRDGLFTASVLEVLHQHAKMVKMANYAQLVNVIPMIVTNSSDLYHNPIYLAFQLFSNYAERYLVGFSLNCDKQLNAPYGNISKTEIPYLGCSVTTNKTKDRLVIIGINRHHAHPLPTFISLDHFTPDSTAEILELNGPTHTAYNYFNKKEEVQILRKTFAPASSQFTYTFPPHSVTALVLRKNSSKH